MGNTLRREQTDDRQVNNLQRNIDSATQTLRDSPYGDGNLVTSVQLTVGTPSTVSHGLGRNLKGWVIHSLQAAEWVLVFVSSRDNTKSVTFDSFGNASTCTFDVWFY